MPRKEVACDETIGEYKKKNVCGSGKLRGIECAHFFLAKQFSCVLCNKFSACANTHFRIYIPLTYIEKEMLYWKLVIYKVQTLPRTFS